MSCFLTGGEQTQNDEPVGVKETFLTDVISGRLIEITIETPTVIYLETCMFYL